MDEIQIKVYVIIVSVYLLASFSLLIGRIMVYCVCLYVRPCFALIVLYVFTISMKRDITQKKIWFLVRFSHFCKCSAFLCGISVDIWMVCARFSS